MTDISDKNQIFYSFFYFFQIVVAFYFLLKFQKIDKNDEFIFSKIIIISLLTFVVCLLFNGKKRWTLTSVNIGIFFCALWANKYEREDIYLTDITYQNNSFDFSRKFNIFFTETNLERSKLNARQMCSIESAALHNPKANVFLFSLKAELNDANFLKKYKNIKFRLTNPEQVYQGTPLEEWWKKQKKKLKSSKFKINDLSDTFRLALVFKYGGLYSDLDILNLKNLDSLRHLNGVCYSKDENSVEVNNAILLFEKNHKFLLAAMNNLISNYKINIWGFNGPQLITRVLKEYCKSQDIYKELVFDPNQEYTILNLNQSYKKCDMVLFHKNFFYPVHWTKAKSLFQKNSSFHIKDFKDSYGVHFYNKITKNLELKLNDNSIYEYFISQNCPLTYGHLLKGNLKIF